MEQTKEQKDLIQKLEAKNKELAEKPQFLRVGEVYEIPLQEAKTVSKTSKANKPYELYQLINVMHGGRKEILEIFESDYHDILEMFKARGYPAQIVYIKRS